jgi:hypothetical protein
MDAVHNKAVIGLSIGGTASGGIPTSPPDGTPGFQVLDLSTSTFGTAFKSQAGNISEDPLVDPIRNRLLSAAEFTGYEIIDLSSTPLAFYENTTQAGGVELDSTTEDCGTQITLAPVEFSNPSSVFIADLSQIALVPGSPGTWTAPSQFQSLSESSLAAGASGSAVAQGTHIGIITGEFNPGTNALTAIQLPAASSGVPVPPPAITDWVTCTLDPTFSNGLDPHTVTAYQSPNSGDAIALLANRGGTRLAVVDLTQMLNPAVVPRTVGGHGCAAGPLSAPVVRYISVP